MRSSQHIVVNVQWAMAIPLQFLIVGTLVSISTRISGLRVWGSTQYKARLLYHHIWRIPKKNSHYWVIDITLSVIPNITHGSWWDPEVRTNRWAQEPPGKSLRLNAQRNNGETCYSGIVHRDTIYWYHISIYIYMQREREMYVYIYIYMWICIYIYMYIYIIV